MGPDDTFHLSDDPNPFDNIADPPPSVLALTAIPNRLYNHADWRNKYAARLKEVLDAVWDEDELLAAVDEMAAIVQRHAPSHEAAAAGVDTERVRKFILKRRGEILADLTPEPPDWPEPQEYEPSGESGALEVVFETTWGSNLSPEPLEEGTIVALSLNGSDEPTEGIGAFAGHSSAPEAALLPDLDELASIVIAGADDDGSVSGMTLVVDLSLLTAGATLVIGTDALAGGVWSIPAGSPTPDSYTPFSEGALELSMAGSTPGAKLVGTFSGVYGNASASTDGDG